MGVMAHSYLAKKVSSWLIKTGPGSCWYSAATVSTFSQELAWLPMLKNDTATAQISASVFEFYSLITYS